MSALGILAQNCFLFSDALLISDVFAQALQVRLGWITGWQLLWMIPLALHPPVWLREGMVAVSTLMVVGAIVYLCSISKAPTAIYQPVGLVLIPMFGSIAFRLRFWYAAALSAATLACAILFIHPVTPLDHVIAQANTLVLGVAILFTLLACYMLEHQERRDFLLTELDRRQRDALAEANADLHDLTTLDPLTGIDNRRKFDAMLALMWAQARESARPLALLMIDVDAFKPFNDRYGHPAGDTCLRQIAAALADTARAQGAVVARIGGDEFAAIAPGLDSASALALGQALHAAVEALAIAHRFSPVSPIISLSIGAASLRPQTWDRPQELIDLADRAVYAAKAAGRNGVSGVPKGHPKPGMALVGGRDHAL